MYSFILSLGHVHRKTGLCGRTKVRIGLVANRNFRLHSLCGMQHDFYSYIHVARGNLATKSTQKHHKTSTQIQSPYTFRELDPQPLEPSTLTIPYLVNMTTLTHDSTCDRQINTCAATNSPTASLRRLFSLHQQPSSPYTPGSLEMLYPDKQPYQIRTIHSRKKKD